MLKEISLISSLAILSVSTALASGITVQKTAEEQKAIIPQSMLIDTNPYFVGIEFGTVASNYNASDFSKVPTTSIDNHKFVGSVYVGYNFNKFLATSIGYTYYNKPVLHENTTGLKQDFYQQSIDLLGTTKAPFAYGIGLYAKGGLTWVFSGAIADNQYFYGHSANSKITEVIGGGVSYDITSDVVADLGWVTHLKNGSLPKMNLYTVGLTYNFNI